MSVKLLDRVWEAPMPTMAMKLVALKLADYANDEGENIYPSVGTIERKTGVSSSVVRECLADMEASGLLEVIEEGCGNRFGRSTTIRRMRPEVLADVASGRLTWQRAAVPVHDQKTGAPKLDGEGKAKMRDVWRLAPAAEDDATTPPVAGGVPLRQPDPTPPAAGPLPLRQPDPNRQREPLLEPPHSARAGKSGGKSQAQPVDEMLERIVLVPKREAVVDHLLAPVLKRRTFRAPDVEHTLAAVADWIAGQGLGEAQLAAAAEIVIDRRREIVNEAALREAVAEVKAGKAPNAPAPGDGVTITRSSQPEAVAAWIAYDRATGNRKRASLLEMHGFARVPSLMPPPHFVPEQRP